MSKFASPLFRPLSQLLSRLQERFRRARSGSVLILVVALLVLMALIGTAFITTARIDRYGAAQNAANTQIELLVEGVKNLVVGSITNDLLGAAGAYRPAGEPEQGSNYEHHDSPLVDLNLASRVPIDEAGTKKWRSLSWPVVSNGIATTPYQFEAPNQHAPVILSDTPGVAGVNYKPEFRFVPSSGPLNGQSDWPHLRIFRRIGGADNEETTGVGIPAADADGDGIADAGLWKLPIGAIDGITYFAASRIIDNNSAWNGSTAWTQNLPNPPLPNLPGNFWPTNINLVAMLAQGPTEMATLNKYRFSDPAPTPAASLAPIHDGAPTAAQQMSTPRADFAFINGTEAMWMNLGRRLEHPGFNTATTLYRALPVSDATALAYKFCLVPPGGASGEIEKLTASYITGAPLQPYTGNQFGQWFTQNFDYAAGFKPLRAITVARNPVANARASYSRTTPVAGEPGFRGEWTAAQPYVFGDWVTVDNQPYLCIRPHASALANTPDPLAVPPTLGLYWEKVPWGDQPTKANINTASFGELWHAFFDVMADRQGDPLYDTPLGSNVRQFRSSSRDIPPVPVLDLTPYQMMQLRSAIAAVNAIDLRDSDSDVTSRDVGLSVSPTDSTIVYEATVFGTERQPYITEVMIDTNGTGFIAIELHNPYPIDIDVTGWRLGAIDRTPTAPKLRVITDQLAMSGMDLGAAVAATTGAPVIPALGYVVLYDGATPSTDIEADMTARNIDPPPVLIPGLATTPPPAPGSVGGFNREIVLLRTRNASGVPSQAAGKPGDGHDEGGTTPLMGDLVPVDQIDLTGLEPATIGGERYAYRRASLPATAWHFVYPGEYDPALPLGTPRHLGMIASPGDLGNLGEGDGYFGTAPLNTAATYLTVPVQIANTDMGGPQKTYVQLSGAAAAAYPPTPGAQHFPFGAFARNGDILQVPFIGAYRILELGDPRDTSVRELNGVSMDAVFADDQVGGNNWLPADTGATTEIREQLGRFVPIGNPRLGVGARGDYEPLPVPTDPSYNAVRGGYVYQWAMDLLDHLTVESPSDDYLPNVDDELASPLIAPPSAPKYSGAQPASVANAKQTVANDHPLNTPVGATEGKVPVEGLININTAPWKVLSALPMIIDPGTNQVNVTANEQLAKDIVAYRDGTITTGPNGPFRSIYDLMRVPEFADAQDAIIATPTEPNDAQGDLSPLGSGAAAADGVRFDFEERFLFLNRISNLITTRSDSYTVYLVVQGWQDAGTANPVLRTQRRLAFIVDRSRVIPTNPQPTVTPVPNN